MSIMRANNDIREMIEKKRIYYWEVANKLNLLDSNFSRLLRTPLSEENKIKVLKAIKEIDMERKMEE